LRAKLLSEQSDHPQKSKNPYAFLSAREQRRLLSIGHVSPSAKTLSLQLQGLQEARL